MSFDKEFLESTLNKVAQNLEFQSYKIIYRCQDESIENYFGVIVPITLIGETKDGELRKDLIVKLPPNKKHMRHLGVIEGLYEVEKSVYTVLMPHYKRLSKIDLCGLFPDCYFSDSSQYNEVFVLKDMCCDGFKRHQNRFLDSEHVIVSLRSLAQFHALAMILHVNIKKREDYYSIIPNCTDYPPHYIVSIKMCLKNSLNLFKNTEKEPFLTTLYANFDNIVDKNVSNVKRLIFGHGDFWKENILYKYEDQTPVKACILDYQCLHLLSPAEDVLRFLLVCVDTENRRQNYEYFLSTYYEYLEQFLMMHDCVPDDLYSKSDFDHDLKVVAPYCFIVTNMSFSIWLGVEEKAIIKSKNIFTEEDKRTSALSYYEQIMFDIIDDFARYGYI